jgi:hypothetical protein
MFWLPGKSNLLFAFAGFCLLLRLLLTKGAGFELYALTHAREYITMTGTLLALTAAIRWLTARLDRKDEQVVQFEEE